MKNDEKSKVESKKRLLLRKQSIRVVDNVDLPNVVGGGESAPPDGGCSTVGR